MATDITGGSISSVKDFKKTPNGQYKYWSQEMKSCEKRLRGFRTYGGKIVNRFTGGTKGGVDSKSPEDNKGTFRLNLFHSNTVTLQSMLYGNLPKVDVSRRYNDPNDDVGRVAAEIMERLLNNDVEDNPETYNSILKATLQDRLLPGIGIGRVRYEVETEEVPTDLLDGEGEPVTEEKVLSEEAPLEYFHWRDVAWGWGRTFADLPWIGFRSYLDKDEMTERFSEDAAEGADYEAESVEVEKEELSDPDTNSAWQKAQVWEIWDKKRGKVVWYTPGYDKVLEEKDDFLGLSGFYPCPPFMVANQTTSLYVPTSDFYIAQDLYNEIDTLSTRISIITTAVKVVGVYDQSATGIKRMFKEGTDNDMIPVDNWAMFSEKGGIKGQIDWVPLKDIVNALTELTKQRDQTIALLQQTTGMSDIMRGELSNAQEGVGQSQMKAKFGSVRVQALQDEFAQFASNMLAIKAEIIGLHYETETIASLCNAEAFQEEDQQLIPQAIELLKNPKSARLRIIIRPESVAMVDYAELRNERTSYLTAVGSFMQAATPIMEAEPATKPFMLQLLQWGLAGFKGASEIEGVIDAAISAVKEAEKQGEGEPDPEEAAAQKAMEMQMQVEDKKHQNNMAEIQGKAQAALMVGQADTDADIKKIMADLNADLQQITAKAQAEASSEQVTSQINAEQQRFATEGEMEKAELEHAYALRELEANHNAKMIELSRTASIKEKSDAARPKPAQ